MKRPILDGRGPPRRPPDAMYLIRRALARLAAAKNNGTSDLWRSHSGVVRRRLFLLYATPADYDAARRS